MSASVAHALPTDVTRDERSRRTVELFDAIHAIGREELASLEREDVRTIVWAAAVVFAFELIYTDDDSPPTVSVDYISPQAAELVRYPIEDWLRESRWLEMVHPDDRDDVARTMERSARTGEPWTICYRMIRSDGEVIWVLDMGSMLTRDSHGRPWTFQGILLDVTEDEEAKARLEQLQAEQQRLQASEPAR